ncbi:hypothetical protein GCM10027569_86560 [Flindersiella endophytica]
MSLVRQQQAGSAGTQEVDTVAGQPVQQLDHVVLVDQGVGHLHEREDQLLLTPFSCFGCGYFIHDCLISPDNGNGQRHPQATGGLCPMDLCPIGLICL